MSHLILLDNEAVQALSHPSHPKHQRMINYVQVVAHRQRRADPIHIAVPTSVRVEAGCDRTSPDAPFVNRLRITDIALDTAHANLSAAIRRRIDVSIADAHLGATIHSSGTQRISVITSVADDMRAVADGRDVTIVVI
jgi:hypothetical protein